MNERKKEGLGFLLFKRVDGFELCHGWVVLPSFDLFHRKNPFGGEYTVFAGLEECIRFAANYHFKEDEISFLRSVLPSTCEEGFFSYLATIDCSDVEICAMPEGSVVFPKVPLIRVEGPLLVRTATTDL
jgi:nicotinate phosphoribosyltransferase